MLPGSEAEPTDETISEVVDLSDVVTWAEPLEISATETSIVRTVDSSIRSPLVSAAVPEKYPTATELIRVGDSWALETPSSPSRSGLAEAGDSLFAGRTAAVAEPVYGIAAIPEPATLGLLWAAFLGLPLTRKRLA